MKVIITGSTGMVGRSTLNECLANDKLKQVQEEIDKYEKKKSKYRISKYHRD